MSERGSFVTQYINCDRCRKATALVLLVREKFLCSQEIQSWQKDDETLPIIAGKIGASHAGGEHIEFEVHYIPDLEKVICHPLRIAVLPDTGTGCVYTVLPGGRR